MEVGWHLRFSREDALVFLVQARLAPNVEDAVFIADGWGLEWTPDPDGQHLAARVTRTISRG